MGREVRRVPGDWEHPKRETRDPFSGVKPDSYQPLFDESYADAMSSWRTDYLLWEGGCIGASYPHHDDPIYSSIVKFDAFCRRAIVCAVSLLSVDRAREISRYARAEGVFSYSGTTCCEHYHEWAGAPPDEDYYRPRWADVERTHYQLYETVSEGTPCSPPMETLEALAAWLAANPAAAHLPRGEVFTYEQWLAFVGVGFAPSFIMDSNGLRSGVAATVQEGTQ